VLPTSKHQQNWTHSTGLVRLFFIAWNLFMLLEIAATLLRARILPA
jgi:hypothetical protein